MQAMAGWQRAITRSSRRGGRPVTRRWRRLSSSSSSWWPAASELDALEDLAHLLERDEEHDGEGALAHHGGDEPLVQGHGPLGPHGLERAVHGAGVRRGRAGRHLHVHHPRLDHVDGVGGRGGDEARGEAGGDVRGEAVGAGAPAREDGLLGLVVGGQLRRRDDHGAVHRERRAAPEAADALVARHPADGVPDAAVVAALGEGQAPVRLHPHHGHVGRVAHGRADAARDEPRRDLAVQRQHAAVLLGPLGLEDVVEPHPRGGVERLAEHGGGHPGEEPRGALGAQDLRADGERAGLPRRRHRDFLRERHGLAARGDRERRAHRRLRRRRGRRLPLQLHADLDEVERVRGAAGHDGGDAALDESLDPHCSLPCFLPRRGSSLPLRLPFIGEGGSETKGSR
ncbi:hypothetical protein C2845_PM14G17090 [Panicum miliaceum]|uniref:Uncharacterized protein n=1 Tax=Panicum miliaceum TaxID=4540 RepID=A0A3L6PPG3_PANMI|nr:hypothetical protein C2845_PM14G17090 [Panicum miliaceum]